MHNIISTNHIRKPLFTYEPGRSEATKTNIEFLRISISKICYNCFRVPTSEMQKPGFWMMISRTCSVRTKREKQLQMCSYLITLATAP